MSIIGDIGDLFKSKESLKNDVDLMMKADGDDIVQKPVPEEDEKDQIGRKAILDDPYFDFTQNHFIFKAKHSRITNKTLKDVSLRDWACSSIIQNRIDTLLRFSRPQRNPTKMEMGFKVIRREKCDNVSEVEREEIAQIEDFIYNCGQKKKVPKDDRMVFGEFLKMTARDAITFGHIAIEKINTRGGGLHRFRPLPGESIFRISSMIPKKTLKDQVETARQAYEALRAHDNNPDKKHKVHEKPIEYYKFVQMSYDNKVLAVFGDEDMVFQLYNPQNFADSLGYCYSPIELAVINITNHLNVENYNANFFTHGYAARGILHLKGTVTQQQLAAFRRQFYNQISGSQHAWKTPIVSGLEDVTFVPLAGSAKEMEYLQYNDHILRAICSQLAIDPSEIGLDYLSRGTGAGGSTAGMSGEEKLQNSRDRGLIPLLMFYEDFVNHQILPLLSEEWAKKYKFIFTGYSEDSPQTNVALLQAEMSVHSSMNDLLRDSHKPVIEDQRVADLPMNQGFWALVEKHMTKGEIREHFFGDKDASKKRELQYFPADPAFMGWQQMLLTIDQAKKQEKMQQQQMQAQQQAEEQQAQQQQDQQDHDKAMAEGKHQREQEQHDAQMKEVEARHRDAVKKESLKEIAKKEDLDILLIECGGL